ncbi:hypothetical protein FRC06_008300 [Ceratobasidium sp. 370]|nr:hypothetical protein FRC06_008300 [Ceratobasidium sp. 370]
MSQPNEHQLRMSLTCEGTAIWVKETIETLAKGLELPPVSLQDGENFCPAELVPNLIEAFAYEVRRRYNVAVYAAAVWKESEDTLAVTQALKMPDARMGDDDYSYSTVQHLAWFALENSGIGRGVLPTHAHPTIWPDFSMGARPSLPPVHPDWREELFHLQQWFTYLWRWQGGRRSPNWAAIVEDINEGRFGYFEKQRLPAAFLPLVDIDHWDEATTRLWSKHIRSAMDGVGRVLPDKRDTAIQFRKIDDRENGDIIHRDFCADADIGGSLDWPLESLLFERRIRRCTEDRHSHRSVGLYDFATPLLSRLASSVADLDELRKRLNDYEQCFVVPEATEATSNWHPAALCVFRQADQVAYNADPARIIYPAEFLSRDRPGHSAWSATALWDFLLRKPFCTNGSGILNGGSSGVAVGFYAILQYAFNVLRVAPKDKEEEEIMIDRDMHVYGRAELRTLAQCVSILLQDLQVSKDKLAATAREPDSALLPCDLEARFGSWTPTCFVEREGDGGEEIIPMTKIRRPSQNAFDTLLVGGGTDSSDAGEESDEGESMSISESEPDTRRTSAAGSIETLHGNIGNDTQESLVTSQVDGSAIARRSGVVHSSPRRVVDLTSRHTTLGTTDVEMHVDHEDASTTVSHANRAAGSTATLQGVMLAQSASSVPNSGAATRLLSFANAIAQRGSTVPEIRSADSDFLHTTRGMPEPSSPSTGPGMSPNNSQSKAGEGSITQISHQSLTEFAYAMSSRGSDQRSVKRVRGKGEIDRSAASKVKRAK